jgi:hypothetical protein
MTHKGSADFVFVESQFVTVLTHSCKYIDIRWQHVWTFNEISRDVKIILLGARGPGMPALPPLPWAGPDATFVVAMARPPSHLGWPWLGDANAYDVFFTFLVSHLLQRVRKIKVISKIYFGDSRAMALY